MSSAPPNPQPQAAPDAGAPVGSGPAGVGTPAAPQTAPPGQAPSGAETPAASALFHPITTQEQLDIVTNDRLKRQKAQLEPQLRQAVLAEVQPQLDELKQLKQSQMGDMERLTTQLTDLATANLDLQAKALAADRKDMIYAAVANSRQPLPVDFWPLIEGNTVQEVEASIERVRATARALVAAPGEPGDAPQQPGGAPPATPAVVGLGSPASPPAAPQPPRVAPQDAEAARARLDAIRRGDKAAVAANIKEHLPQIGFPGRS